MAAAREEHAGQQTGEVLTPGQKKRLHIKWISGFSAGGLDAFEHAEFSGPVSGAGKEYVRNDDHRHEQDDQA